MSGYLSLADGRAVAVRDGFTIGRGAGCDLVLDDGKASRKHVRIVVEGGVVEVEDLGSSNGTLLNGKPVTKRMLRGGDEVQIGTTVLVYREGAVPGAASAGVAGGGPGKAAVFDDEDDLFGGGGDAAPVPTPASRSAPAPQPAHAPQAPPKVQTPPPSPPSPPPPAPPKTAVVEFADEVVEVRKQAPVAAPKAASPAEPAVASKQRILQYSQNAGRGGVLGDDLGQMSGGKRGLLIAIVLAAAGALAFAVMKLVR